MPIGIWVKLEGVMYLCRLQAINFRNYSAVDVELEPGQILLFGDNAQGKTNFLEAIYLLALTRSFRPGPESELISWRAKGFPFTRLVGHFVLKHREIKIELVIQSGGSQAKKRLRLNNQPTRARDVVGLVNVVLFTAQDMELVFGPPSLRRRYLNILGCQMSSHYLHQLQIYEEVLEHRNKLLSRIREGLSRPDELEFWDRRLTETGAYITAFRSKLIEQLNRKIKTLHYEFTQNKELLELHYIPSLGESSGEERTRQAFEEALARGREREISMGMTLRGPHRDELRFVVEGKDLGISGSRGQQRTAALSLKLAEAEILREHRQDSPILLLDDAFSELDPFRRRRLAEAVTPYQQVFLTSVGAELTEFSPSPERLTLFLVKEGSVTRMARDEIETV